MRKIDLHVHTSLSDGSFSPYEVVAEAKRADLTAIAITDHDCADGCDAAMNAGEKLGVEVIKGIEITSKNITAIHILGYFINENNPILRDFLKWVVDDRENRNRKIVRLMQDDGLMVNYEDMCEKYGHLLGRPHFAMELVNLGLANSVNDAFARYVNKGRKYFIGRTPVSVEKAVRIISESGGVPILAHPFQYHRDDSKLRELIEIGIENGMQGIECRYSGYSKQMSDYLENLAEEYGLIKTGGSDFHGKFKPHIQIGKGSDETLEVPYDFLSTLKAAAKDNCY